MKAAYWQRGESLDYVNATTKKIEAGDVLIIGNHIGVAGTDIEPGALGSVHVTGVYEFAKKDTAELTPGMTVYLTADGVTASAAEGSGDDVVTHVQAGFVAATSPAKSTKAYVKINA